jgi:nucleoside-diphosphate-sugar epimerase
MRTVAIFGASGFIGSNATSAFRSRGDSVLALSRSAHALNCSPVDYMDVNALARALIGVDSVVHVAGLAHVSAKSLVDAEHAYYLANVMVAVNVAKAANMAGVAQFVLLSSAGVLGPQSPPEGFDDSVEPRPYDLYTKSKLEAERCVLEIVKGNMGLVILRPPTVYGPNAPGSFRRLSKWIEQGFPLPVGRIFARRSFIGIRNLCSALMAAEASSQTGILPMIVADREPVSIGEFVREIARANGRRSLVVPVPQSILEFGLHLVGLREEYRRIALPFELRPSRIHSLLNWQVPYSLAEELRWGKSV